MLAHLRTANVLVPAAAVLERIGLAARLRARKRAFQALADGLTEAEREGLDALLAVDPLVRQVQYCQAAVLGSAPASCAADAQCREAHRQPASSSGSARRR
jgi:hypothetical protein